MHGGVIFKSPLLQHYQRFLGNFRTFLRRNSMV